MNSQTTICRITLASTLAIGVTAAWVLIVMAASIALNSHERTGARMDSMEGAGQDSILVPSAIMLAFLQLVILPLNMSRGNTPGDGFWPHFNTMMAVTYPSLAIVVLLSIALAIWVYYRHRRYSPHEAATWAAFVVLMGVPGLIGYLLHRLWPVVERCRSCGKDSPRDRDACLHCGTEFQLPPVKGIEIFA